MTASAETPQTEWKRVPVEPTEDEIEAGCRAMHAWQGSGNADAPRHSPYQNSWNVPDSVRWKQWDETVREVRAAMLAASPAQEQVATATPMQVKPLEWGEDDSYPGSDTHSQARALGINYRIARIWNGAKQQWAWWLTGTVVSDDWYDTLEAAQAAAQADYERRINSALVTADDRTAERIKEVLEEEGHAGNASGWTPCSGCYDTEDGYPTGHYDHSDTFGCTAGSGCYECGGIGVVWERWTKEDLEAMARDDNEPSADDRTALLARIAELEAQPSEAVYDAEMMDMAYRNSIAIRDARIAELEKALGSFMARMNRNGDWDEGCFYYNNRSAPELHDPIAAARAALAGAQS